MKRAVAMLLTCALGVASAVPVLGTRMVCGPSPDASMSRSAMLPGDGVCPSRSDCPESPATASLLAGSCCRLAPVDESNALAATLTSGRAPAPDDGRTAAVVALPLSSSPVGATLAAARSIAGSPPTTSPPRPTRTTILRN